MRILLLAIILAGCGPIVVGPDADTGASPCLPLCDLASLPDGGQVVRCGGPDRRDRSDVPWCERCDFVREPDGGVVIRVDCY